MATLTDLRRWMTAPTETEHLEFKEAKASFDKDKLVKYCAALANLYIDRKTREGWPRERLVPMLAGLRELIPWVKQWHNEPSANYDGLRMGDYFAQFLDGELRLQALTPADLRAWRPAKRTRAKAKPTSPSRSSTSLDTDAPAPKPKHPRKPKPSAAE